LPFRHIAGCEKPRPVEKSGGRFFGAARLEKIRRPAMSEGLTGTTPELIAVWRAAMDARGRTTREVDHDAGLGDGYFAKILCGLRTPTAPTIAKINRALGLEMRFVLLPSGIDALTP
jgi:DNA-binding phage protein